MMVAGKLFSLDVVGQAVRFVFAGAANTLLSLIVFQALLFVVSYQIAYAIAWLAGLAFVLAIYPTKVFPGGRTDTRARLWLGASYAGIFGVGLAALHGLSQLDISPRIAVLAVLALTTVLNFATGRLVLGSAR